jgi:hypothetical protein
LYLFKQNTASWESSSGGTTDKLLGEFPMNDVAQITVRQDTNTLNLAKDSEAWKVKDRYNYPANFSEIHELLRKLWELKGVQKVKLGPSQLGRLQLLPPDKGTNGGTLVEFKDKNGKTLASLLLGKKHLRQQAESNPMMGEMGGYPDGRFVLVPVNNSSTTPDVWVVTESFNNLEPKPEPWLNREFVKIEKIKSVSVVFTNATNNWTLERETETGEMKLADKKDGEDLDTSKIYGVNNLFSSVNISDVVAPTADPKSLGLDQPISATINTFDHFTYQVQIGSKTNDDNYPVHVTVSADLPKERTPGKDEKAEDKAKLDKEFKEKTEKLQEKLKNEKAFEKWTFLLPKYTVDALLKPRPELLAVKKEEPKKDPGAAALNPADLLKPAEPMAAEKADAKADNTPPPVPEEKIP